MPQLNVCASREQEPLQASNLQSQGAGDQFNVQVVHRLTNATATAVGLALATDSS